MSNAQRTDPHRPGAIVPADYEYVFSYSLATTCDDWPVPAVNVRELIVPLLASARRGEALLFEHPTWGWATGKCSVCGAHFLHGDVWRHVPTGEHLTLGHICAEKYSLAADRGAWEVLRGRAIDRARNAARRRWAAQRFQSVLRGERDLRAAFIVARTDSAVHDISRKVATRWGEPTDGQCRLVLAVARRILEQRANPDPPALPIPEELLEGRHVVRGKVLGTKSQPGYTYHSADVLKMLVRVPVEGGAFKLWGTAPDSILGDGPIRGRTVEFTARIQQSPDDRAFGFFSRPTKAHDVTEEPKA